MKRFMLNLGEMDDSACYTLFLFVQQYGTRFRRESKFWDGLKQARLDRPERRAIHWMALRRQIRRRNDFTRNA
jgi:hypothetical protein